MAKPIRKRDAAELEHLRQMLIARSAVQRLSLSGATEDFQDASDRIVRIATAILVTGRRFWLPIAALAATALFKRTRPILRLARTGLTIWQVARMVRSARR